MELAVPSHRPRFTRAVVPPTMRFQTRDGAILQAIYDYDGVLARRHLKAMFWPQCSWRAMEMRLSVLYHNGYLDWPSQEQWRTRPIPEAVYWLGWKGALWIAGRRGIEITPPTTPNETQLRILEARLRKQSIRWVREPHWSQLEHDLAIVEVRLKIEQAVQQPLRLTLEAWIPEGAFRAQMDVVEFEMRRGNGALRRRKRGVCPDGCFVLRDKEREAQGRPARARFLLELDHATHDNPAFAAEKAMAGLAYLQSKAYENRFGENSGRWLVVTTGDVRMQHLLRTTGEAIGDGAATFFFTTFDKVMTENVLTSPIWWQVGWPAARSLLSA